MKKIYLLHESNKDYIDNIIDNKYLLSSKITLNSERAQN